MIGTKQLASTIEEALNQCILDDTGKENPLYPCLHHLDPQTGLVTDYRFRIFAEAGDYKQGDRNGNIITRYINGEFASSGGTSETTQDGRVNSAINGYITFAIALRETQEKRDAF